MQCETDGIQIQPVLETSDQGQGSDHGSVFTVNIYCGHCPAVVLGILVELKVTTAEAQGKDYVRPLISIFFLF